MTREHRAKKITMYGCPSPRCEVVTGAPEEMSDHINDEHEDEWDKGYWPSPEGDDGPV